MKPVLHSITGFFINKGLFRTLFLGGLFLLIAAEGWGQTAIASNSGPICSGQNVLLYETGVGATSWLWSSNGSATFSSTTAQNPIAYGAADGEIFTVEINGNISSATTTVVVNPILPVSLTISSTATTVCSGTSVTYTATPINGGLTPSYQWKVNGINAGNDQSTYNYVPTNNDVITCVLTSSEVCSSGSPATSTGITMTVNANLPVSLTISSTATTVCSGTSVTYTATPINGGLTPSYQWKVNGINAGNDQSTYNYVPTNNDVITCVLTSSEVCSSGSPATSTGITMTVNANLPVSLTISSTATTVCSGTSVTYTATPINGGLTPSYQWKVNGINAGNDQSTYNYVPTNNDVITCVLTSSEVCSSGSPATSTGITMTVNANLPVSLTISSTATTVCSGTSVTYTATPINGGLTPSYQWKVNGINAGNDQSTYNYVPTNNDVITCVLTSSEVCSSGSPATSTGITMTVNANLPVSLTISSTATTVCSGTSVTYTATPINGGLTPSYQWKVNGINAGNDQSTYNYVPTNNDVITCVLTSSEVCSSGSPATSTGITMTVNANLPVSLTISSTATTVCSGTSVTYTATPINGGLTPSYQWKVNGINAGNDQSTYNYVPTNNDVITCVLTSSEVCSSGSPATSTGITMTVNANLPVSLTISSTATTVCSGTSVTYTATPINGGLTPSYQWKVNGINAGNDQSTYNYVPTNNDVITCVLTSSEVCSSGSPATSTGITMTVNANLPVSLTISSTATTVCSGTSVTYTATPINGGLTPSYQWKVNGINAGNDQSTYNYVPTNNDVITCVLTSSEVCSSGSPATSTGITMTVNANLPVSLTISSTATTVCSGTSVTYTATPINGGLTPSYQWKVNGINAGNDQSTYNYVPTNNDVITCVLTSSEVCSSGSPATSTGITMTVNANLPVSLTISSTATTVCSGTSVTYTATPINGGLTPSYQWKVNGINAGNDQSTYNYVPTNNDVITCVLTSSEVCSSGSPATSTGITMIVNLQPGAIIGKNYVSTGSMATLDNITLGGTWSSGTTSVAEIDPSTGIVTGVSSGTSIITYTLGTGCSVSTIINVLPSGWEFNPPSFTHNGQITAKVFIDEIAVESGFLAAFVGTECRGIVEASYFTPSDHYVFGLMIHSNSSSGETITFRFFDPASNKSKNLAKTLDFVDDMIIGNAVTPVNMQNGIDFNKSFTAGWNWFSINATTDIMTLKYLLSNNFVADDYIKDQLNSATYYSGFGWFGTLSVIDPKKLYKLKVQNASNVNFCGIPVDNNVTQISLVTGWNWIGYLPQSPIPVNTALASYSSANLDYIKNHTNSSTYYAGSGWFGSLTNMSPGEGYMIKVANPGTLQYPDAKGKTGFLTDSDTDKPLFDPSSFEFNGSVTAKVKVDGVDSGSERDLLYAFVNGQLRGVAKGVYFDPKDVFLYPIMIHSNLSEGEVIEFRYQDSETGKLYPCRETGTFRKDMIVADAIKPLELNTSLKTKSEVTQNLQINAYPNPFDQVLNIEYDLPVQSNVRLIVYDPYGRIVKVLVDKEQQADHYTTKWIPDRQLSGMYIIKLQSGNRQVVKKVTLLE